MKAFKSLSEFRTQMNITKLESGDAYNPFIAIDKNGNKFNMLIECDENVEKLLRECINNQSIELPKGFRGLEKGSLEYRIKAIDESNLEDWKRNIFFFASQAAKECTYSDRFLDKLVKNAGVTIKREVTVVPAARPIAHVLISMSKTALSSCLHLISTGEAVPTEKIEDCF